MTEIKKARSSVGALEQATDENAAGAAHCVNVQAHDNMAGSYLQHKLALKPKEAAALIGVGVNRIYQLCHRADFPAVWIGRTCVIPVDGLRRWLDAQAEGGAAGDF
ncbi:MAG: helix-turn-helix domain-containing protein [Oscillospiraceae bacterium]|nr:helix-turn-helix domain-containing protein [Oscillospiraceae bacterium]